MYIYIYIYSHGYIQMCSCISPILKKTHVIAWSNQSLGQLTPAWFIQVPDSGSTSKSRFIRKSNQNLLPQKSTNLVFVHCSHKFKSNNDQSGTSRCFLPGKELLYIGDDACPVWRAKQAGMGDRDLHTLIPFHHIPDLAKNFGKTPQSLPLSSEKSKVHGPQLSKTLLMLLEFFFGPFHLAFQLLGTLLNQLYTGPDPLILNFDLLCGLFRDLFFFEDFDGLSSNDIAEQYLRAQQQQWGEQRPHCGVEAKVRIDISKPGIDAVLYVSTSGSVSYSTKKRYTVILQLVGAYLVVFITRWYS